MRYQTNVFLDRTDISDLRAGKPIIIEQSNGVPPIIIQVDNPTRQKVLENGDGREPVKCDECDKSFKNEHGLALHKTRTHGITKAKGVTANSKGKYVCQTCGNSFTNHWGYAAHQRKHNKREGN